jgi:hypothetical protein
MNGGRNAENVLKAKKDKINRHQRGASRFDNSNRVIKLEFIRVKEYNNKTVYKHLEKSANEIKVRSK